MLPQHSVVQGVDNSTCDAAVELAVLCEDKELHGKERPTAPTIQRSEVTMRVPQPSWQPLFTQRHHRVEGVDVPAACAVATRPTKAFIPMQAVRWVSFIP